MVGSPMLSSRAAEFALTFKSSFRDFCHSFSSLLCFLDGHLVLCICIREKSKRRAQGQYDFRKERKWVVICFSSYFLV
jgi:hypothetical protein